MIETVGLVKYFGNFRALDSLDMTVQRGTVYGLVGPNGAGKTTLLRHLTGVYIQDLGSVKIDGEEVFENIGLKSRIVSISDDLWFYPQSATKDMKDFYKRMYPRFNESRYEKLKDIFTFSEKHALRKLSKGMRKQASFWIAMCLDPEIVLLDEPVDGLDPVMRRQIWGILLGDAAERGTTVVVSSHNLRELEDVCDHVGIMNHGRMVLERSLSELQGGTVKLQVAFASAELPELPPEISVLHKSSSGRLHQLIVRGGADEVVSRISALSPLFIDPIPLTLEEIFIYEMGGEDYAVKDILL